ncbi:3150_t:CDS:1, partial [Dentiscutata erythropus]
WVRTRQSPSASLAQIGSLRGSPANSQGLVTPPSILEQHSNFYETCTHTT